MRWIESRRYRQAKDALVRLLESSERDGEACILLSQASRELAELDEAVDYGLTTNLQSFHPVRVAFHEWVAMWHKAAAQRDWRDRLAVLLRPPGFCPAGTSRTARQMQQDAGLRLKPSRA